MKKGLNAWAFPQEMPMPERMAIAQKAGYDGFEVLYELDGFVGMNSTDQSLREVKKIADDLGLEIPSIVGTHYENTSPASGDRANADEFLERFKRMMHAAAALGADTALLVPGRVEKTTVNRYGQYDVAYDNAIENVAKLAPIAQSLGVYVGVENVWNKFLLSPIEFRTFVDHAQSEWIGCYYDVGNIIPYGYPEQWIRILGKRIRKVHVKDFRAAVGNWSGFVDLLAGDVDFAEVMAALREVGYEGYLTAEVSPYPLAPEAMAYQTSRALDFILAM